ncbi:MAG TPA: Gfo/Idh/MocA family oxidoreductase [candidate division Zixibacteria bacterium]|nr:Gfo/Idh/MocA family oxidoreductase [candidate division Zixibacteria bacterium]
MKTIGIIGLGKWGKNHVRNIERLHSEGFCDKVVICDADESRIKQIGDLNNIPIENRYNDLDKLLENEKLSGAILAIPTKIHKEIALKVLEHCDILCEKPLAPTLEECKAISNKAKQYNRIIQVGHLERYNPVVVTLKSLLEQEGTEKKIMHLTGRRVGPGPTKLNSDDLDPNYLGCGHDFMVHDVDVVNGLLEKIPKKVTATACYIEGFPYEVELFAIFEYEGFKDTNSDPILFDCRATWRAYPNLKRRKLVVQTSKDVITLDFILQSIMLEKGLAQHSLSNSFSDYVGAYRATEIINHYLAVGKDQEPLYLEDKDFLACIDSRKKPLVSDVEGTNAVKCIVAAIESAKTGKAVEIK